MAALPIPVYDVLYPEPKQDDCDLERDASDDPDAPSRIFAPQTCVGVMTTRDRVDVYEFHAEAGQWVEVALDPDQTEPYMYACVQAPLAEAICYHVNYPDIRQSLVMQTAGLVTVYLQYESWRDIEFDYTMRIRVVGETPAAPQDDCGLGHGAANSYMDASPVALPVDCRGKLAGLDAWDFYRFHVLLGQDIDVDLDVQPWVDHEVCLYGPHGGWPVACSTLPTGADESIRWTNASERGEWRVVVYRYAGDATYGLKVRVHGEPLNEKPSGWLRCPWYVDVGETFTCDARIDDFDSAGVRGDLTWFGESGRVDVSIPTDGFVAPGTPLTITHAFAESGWTAVRLVAEDSDGEKRLVGFDHIYARRPVDGQDDCGSGGDAGNAFLTATPITASFRCEGTLVDLDDEDDWYAIDAVQGDVIRADFSGADSRLCVVDPLGVERACFSWWEPLRVEVDVPGTWRIHVRSWTSDTYALSVATHEETFEGSTTFPEIVPSKTPVVGPIGGFDIDLTQVEGTPLALLGDAPDARYFDTTFSDAAGEVVGYGSAYADGETWLRVPPGAASVHVRTSWVSDIAIRVLS